MESRVYEQLVKLLGKGSVLHTPEDLAVYGYDGTFAEGQPEVVVLPVTTEEVSAVVSLAAVIPVKGWTPYPKDSNEVRRLLDMSS